MRKGLQNLLEPFAHLGCTQGKTKLTQLAFDSKKTFAESSRTLRRQKLGIGKNDATRLHDISSDESDFPTPIRPREYL